MSFWRSFHNTRTTMMDTEQPPWSRWSMRLCHGSVWDHLRLGCELYRALALHAFQELKRQGLDDERLLILLHHRQRETLRHPGVIRA